MKKLTLVFLTILCSVWLFGQSSDLAQLAQIRENGNWIKMLPEARITANQFFDDHLTDLCLDENYHFESIEKLSDKLAFSHYCYQKFFNGSDAINNGRMLAHIFST